MKKIIDYKVLCSDISEENPLLAFEKLVTQYLVKGYKLGTFCHDKFCYYQVVYREVE